MMKRTIFLLVVMMCIGCSRRSDFTCVEELRTRVPMGASLDAAESAVKECGMEYSVDKAGKVLRAVKRGGKKGLTQESRVVVIKLDESNRVSALEIKSEFTGP